MSTKPQIVLVPGAWHLPSGFHKLTAPLESHNYTIHSRQMPSVGSEDSPNPPQDLTQDVKALQDLVTQAIGSGNDVLVVAHSWGGIVSTSALVGFGKKEREARGEKGGVIRIAFIASIVWPEGTSLTDGLETGPEENKTPDWFDMDVYTPILLPFLPSLPPFSSTCHNPTNNPTQGPLARLNEKALNTLYNDLPDSEARSTLATCKSHAWASMATKTTGDALKNIPASYLICEDDLAVPLVMQDMMVKGAKDRGVDMTETRIKAGHSPFLSQPDVVVRWIRKAAGEDV
jgi:pimeloyl-ACP methyl ester carboxylesterase